MKYRLHLSYLLIAIFCLLLGGCSGSSSASRKEHSGPPRDSTPKVLTPSADGVTVYQMILLPLMRRILRRAMLW